MSGLDHNVIADKILTEPVVVDTPLSDAATDLILMVRIVFVDMARSY